MKKKELTKKRKKIISNLISENGYVKPGPVINAIRSNPKHNMFFDKIQDRALYYLIDFNESKEESVLYTMSNDTKTDMAPNDYKKKFVLSAWNTKTGQMMDIDLYCEHYKLPRHDITSYKLVSHTGTPYYNIVFKENVSEVVKEFDFDGIISKYVDRIEVIPCDTDIKFFKENDYDMLTYTDVHVGMDTNSDNNSMYATEWNKEVIMESALSMVEEVLIDMSSSCLVVDELGDFLDGLNGYTTRGGHKLPQNMTDEEAFDCALEFKMFLLDNLAPNYTTIIFNNICNDNHAGSFGYFVNSAFKQMAEKRYPAKVRVTNHRQFINHYFMGDICYVITHGKDDKTLKFGFKPFLDSKGIEKIDQYCKQNSIYANSSKIVFKKGDSHQCLFDMATSDDFYYFNYPALSPSSQWVQNNFKKGRRGFVIETVKDMDIDIKVKFL
jgi:hypothetical protein